MRARGQPPGIRAYPGGGGGGHIIVMALSAQFHLTRKLPRIVAPVPKDATAVGAEMNAWIVALRPMRRPLPPTFRILVQAAFGRHRPARTRARRRR